MSEESERLRAGIRSGDAARGIPADIECMCLWPHHGDYHLKGCPWIAAVLRIYEIEREEENAPPS